MLNIPSTVVDPTYRYRMPKMQLKIESKGNGIKTNIVNLPDVAKHLRTDESYILKYFGFQKASQTIEKASDNKSNKNAKTNTSYIIQGSFTDDELLKVLDKFIDKYILCPKCKLPEMSLYIKNDRVNGKCDSCPFNGEVDNKHRLTSLILKNPPVVKAQIIKPTKVIEVKNVDEKKEKMEEKAEQKTESETIGKKQEFEPASKIFSSDNLEFGSNQLSELIEYTRKYIESKKNEDFDIASAQAVDNLKPLGLKKALFAYVVFNALFTVNIAKQVEASAPMYKKLMRRYQLFQCRLVGSSEEANELETILNLEYLFLEVNKEKDFSKFISTILNKLHENELLSKQFLIKWSQGEIKEIDKCFLFNEARNEKFIKLSEDFIGYLNDSDDEEEQK